MIGASNEAEAGASHEVMDAIPRHEHLLMRAFDGEASDAERVELAGWADAEPRLAELAELRGALREALAVPGPVDLAGDVLELLMEDAAWAPMGDALRDAVAAPTIDLADAVLDHLDADLELSAWTDGELAPERKAAVVERLRKDPAARETLAFYAESGRHLREALSTKVDVWPGVADAIGADPSGVAGWEPVADQLRDAFRAIPEIDIAGAVQAAIEPRLAKWPRWASLAVPLAGFAAAAAMLLAVLPSSLPTQGLGSLATFALAAVNDAQIEEIETAPDVTAQVMQFEEGGPTIILVEEDGYLAEPSAPAEL